MAITRISEIHYSTFINKLANKTWKKSLSKEAMQQIFLSAKLLIYRLPHMMREEWGQELWISV